MQNDNAKSEMRNPKSICAPIQEKSQKKVIKRLKELKGKVDLAEIWLDHIGDLNISELLKNKPLPVLCVCKKPSDRGKFKGTYAEMADVLVEAAKCSADYIDIPLDVPKKHYSTTALQHYSTKLILSYHDFKKTPKQSELLKIAKNMKKSGADIVKIAVMAKSLNDTFSVILLAQQLQAKKIPHILIAMGKKGILSRILTPFLGGTIMFAPISSKGVSASGQLTVKELREAWGMIK